MGGKRILFIGGTGKISSACVLRALALGHEVTVLNRGRDPNQRPFGDAEHLTGDIRSPEMVRAALGGRSFDVVADFIAFLPEHVRTDVDLFRGRTAQYVFISSASAYQTPPARLPVTESTPLRNPLWAYSRDKIACEDLLVRAYRDEGFPATIVRPSHTYDATKPPTTGGWTDLTRLLEGRPAIVHGDGTSLWTLTHHTDFAVGFVGLLGRPEAVGDSFHITSDEAPTWNQIYTWLAEAAGAEPRLVHVPSEVMARIRPELTGTLLGDKAHSMVFDNQKVKALVPDFRTTIGFSEGAGELVEWYRAHPEVHPVDEDLDHAFDRMAEAMTL